MEYTDNETGYKRNRKIPRRGGRRRGSGLQISKYIYYTRVNGSVVQVSVRGMGSVKMALKRCKLDDDREYRATIVRELRIMSSGHTNLIKLREAAIHRDEVWMAMDLMQCSVFAVLCHRALPEENALYIVRQILNALIFLHSKGYIHRDVKCENLLLGYNGEVKLGKKKLAH